MSILDFRIVLTTCRVVIVKVKANTFYSHTTVVVAFQAWYHNSDRFRSKVPSIINIFLTIPLHLIDFPFYDARTRKLHTKTHKKSLDLNQKNAPRDGHGAQICSAIGPRGRRHVVRDRGSDGLLPTPQGYCNN